MPDFPAYRLPPPPVLTPYHPDSLGNSVLAATSTDTFGNTLSTAWPTSNLAFFYPFQLYDFATAYQLLWFVGGTAAGNIDVGIYDSQANLIISAGSTAMSATINTVQELNIADTALRPGEYFLAGGCTLNTGTVFARSIGDELVLSSRLMYEQATAVPLPAAAAPVLPTGVGMLLPVIGIQFRSSPF